MKKLFLLFTALFYYVLGYSQAAVNGIAYWNSIHPTVLTATNVLGNAILTTNSGNLPSLVSQSTFINSNAWGLSGNSSTVAGTNFIGTTDAVNLVFKVNGSNSGILDQTNFNTFFGVNSNSHLSSGQYNTAIGYNALFAIVSGSGNTMVGSQAGLHETSNDNTAVGDSSLVNASSATNNTAVGRSSLERTTTGGNNTAVGYKALHYNTTQGSGTAVGYYALLNSTGKQNTAIGDSALAETTTGTNNVAIGYQAGATNTTGSNQVFLGNSSVTSFVFAGGASNTTPTNWVLGNGVTATTQANTDASTDVATDAFVKNSTINYKNSSSLSISATTTVTQDSSHNVFYYGSSSLTSWTMAFSGIIDHTTATIDYLKTTSSNLIITFPASTIISVASTGTTNITSTTATLVTSDASGRYYIIITNIHGVYTVLIQQNIN